jgi:L-aspartate oxidase
MKKGGTEHVYLDCRPISAERLASHFPTIWEKCRSEGMDMSKDAIPVAPAAHYSCGGIKTDQWGRTSIHALYACGECASTGLHGANRLASNSLLEALVFSYRCYLDSGQQVSERSFREDIPNWNAEGTTQPGEMILITQSIKELQMLMSDYVGIVRSNTRLGRAMKRLDLLHEETEALYETTAVSPQLCELRNLITTAYLVVKGAQFRTESRGLHYNTDYPVQSELIQNIVL